MDPQFYKKIGEMDGKLDSLITLCENNQRLSEQRFEKVETRVAGLEMLKNRLLGGSAALVGLFGVVKWLTT